MPGRAGPARPVTAAGGLLLLPLGVPKNVHPLFCLPLNCRGFGGFPQKNLDKKKKNGIIKLQDFFGGVLHGKRYLFGRLCR